MADPKPWQWAPRIEARRENRQRFSSLVEEITPLVAQGDRVSLERAQQKAQQVARPQRRSAFLDDLTSTLQGSRGQQRVEEEDEGGGGLFGAIGRVFGEVDKPISERLGISIPDLPGPFDEAGNFLLEEATRPTTLAIAVGGAGLAAKAGATATRLGARAATQQGARAAGTRAGQVIARGAQLATEPVLRGGLGRRVAGETALGVGARVGAEQASNLAGEDAPWTVRFGLGLTGGLAGGAAGARASQGILRGGGVESAVPRVNRLRADQPDALPPTAPNKLGELFGLREPPIEASPIDRVQHMLRETIDPHQRITDEQVKPFMRERERLLGFGGVVDSYANEVGAVADITARQAFDFDGVRIPALAGVDLAAARGASSGPVSVDPRSLEFREHDQYTAHGMRDIPTEEFNPITTILEPDGSRSILDGHNRTSLALERGDPIEVVDIPREDYDALIAAGFDDIEIAAATLHRAGLDEAAEQLDLQFRGARVDERSYDALEAWEQRSPKVASAGTTASDVVGAPTLSDIAAKLPLYEPHLTPEQITALREIEAELRPLYEAMTEQGIEIASRPDIIEGGFYIPRGGADLPNAEPSVGGGRGRAGGKKGFERPTKFESQAAGVEVGYEYDSPGAAIQDYVRQASHRAIDAHTANYLKALTDAEGNLIHTSAADRIDPSLRSQAEVLRMKMAGRRQTLRNQGARLPSQQQAAREAGSVATRADELAGSAAQRAEAARASRQRPAEVLADEQGMVLARPAGFDDTDGVLKAAERELNVLRREARKAAKRAAKAGARPERTLEGQSRVLREIADLEAEYADLNARWKRNKQAAAQSPRGTRQIDMGGLEGRAFPEQVAAAANKFLDAQKPPTGRGTQGLRAVHATNRLLRMLNATLDVSFMGIQGLLGAVTDPLGYAKAMRIAYQAMRDPQALGSYLRTKDPAMLKQAVRDGVRISGAGATNEFTTARAAGTPLHSIARLLEDADWAKGRNPVRGANRMFGTFGDVMRLELYEGLDEVVRAAGFDAADPAVRAAVANASNLMTGTGSRTFLGDDLGGLVMFAPRFFQSQLDLVGKGLGDGTIEGALARRTLTRLIGAGVGLTVAANTALGNDSEFDPESPNFMRIRVGGEDVSLFGPWDSFLKATMHAADGDLGYVARTKASPVVSRAWDLIAGESFIGEDTRSMGYILRSFAPFSLQDTLREGPGAGTPFELAGVKATPMSPTDRLDTIASLTFGADFYDLEPAQKEAIKQAHPELWQEAVERGSDERQVAESERSRLKAEQEADDELLLSGMLTREDWRKERDRRRTEQRALLDHIYGSGEITAERAASDPMAKFALAIDQATDARTGRVHWDSVDLLRATEFTEAENRYIDENSGAGDTPLSRLYRELASEYYELPRYRGYTADEATQIDLLVQEARNRARSSDDAAMLVALRKVAEGYDPQVVTGARRSILGMLQRTRERERYERQHPEVAIVTGRGSFTEREREAVAQAIGQSPALVAAR